MLGPSIITCLKLSNEYSTGLKTLGGASFIIVDLEKTKVTSLTNFDKYLERKYCLVGFPRFGVTAYLDKYQIFILTV
jgi:hypothetical protein